MDARRFDCALMDPDIGLFLGAVFSVFLPPRMECSLEIAPDKLVFRPVKSGEADKVLDKVLKEKPLERISRLEVRHLSAAEQRSETFLKSLWRMTFFGGMVFLYSFVLRGHAFVSSLAGGLVTALVIGPLNFSLNGGFASKQALIRLRFLPEAGEKAFYLEVAPEQEAEILAALREAGIRLQE